MEFIEVSAKTIDEALTEASISLGIPSSEIEYEVVEKGSTGFLGLGSKNAVDELTERMRNDGYNVISGPRTTGDGYYESCIVGIEGNQIEITE